MSGHEKFSFDSIESLNKKIKELGLDIKLKEDLSPLNKPVPVGGKTAPNSFCALPMEGCDSGLDGTPGELVRRRYLRLARGGYGLIWWEACAVTEEGRANERQLWLTPDNARVFQALLLETKAAALQTNGFVPVNILQLTHSGRYSRPEGHKAKPLIVQHDPLLDPPLGILPDAPVLTDEYLDSLVQKYVCSARLARQAGFDGVDVKCCHRYLFSELLAGFTRQGKYGGSLENRMSLILTIIEEIKKACGPDFIVACRFNAFDAHPYPYGFGCDKENMWKFDSREPVSFVKALCKSGAGLLAVSAGNPYYVHPQVTRPFDLPGEGAAMPEEHPLESLARLFELARTIQAAAGEVPVAGSGYSWLRQYIPYAASANLSDGGCGFLGLGRSSFAYPDAPRDIMEKGGMDPKKCCVSCSKCTQIMRDHGMTGCVVRDSEQYVPLYRRYRAEAAERNRTM